MPEIIVKRSGDSAVYYWRRLLMTHCDTVEFELPPYSESRIVVPASLGVLPIIGWILPFVAHMTLCKSSALTCASDHRSPRQIGQWMGKVSSKF